jgi:hypothetical protein
MVFSGSYPGFAPLSIPTQSPFAGYRRYRHPGDVDRLSGGCEKGMDIGEIG